MNDFKMTEGDLSFTFRTGTGTLDNRKDKVYIRNITVHGTCTQEVWKESSIPFMDLLGCLKRAFHGWGYSPEIYIEGGWGTHRVSVVFKIPAEKPSQIPDEAKAWEELMANPSDVTQKIVEAFTEAHAGWKEERAVEKRQRDAATIRDWAVQTIRKDAKSIVRYDGRLAGLEAEIEEQFEKQRPDMEKKLLETDSHGAFDPRSIQAGLKAAQATASQKPNPFDTSFSTIDKKEVM